jgi:D-alanyl-D-alanine endopeptidase (penicillin-binding protein 7)
MPRLLILLALILSQPASAVSLAVYNITEERWRHSENLNQTRPIASLTKLMTVMVSLDQDQDLDRVIKLNQASPRLVKGSYSRRTLITAVLVRSDNSAAEALAEAYPGGRREFVQSMNRKAQALAMWNTRFVDASGLSSSNRSTAHDVITMIRTSDLYPVIAEISTQKTAALESGQGKRLTKLEIENTNRPVLIEFDGITVSKTGFTNSAGWCMALVVVRGGSRSAVVILGADTQQRRFRDIKEVMLTHMAAPEPELPKQATPGDRIRSWLGVWAY